MRIAVCFDAHALMLSRSQHLLSSADVLLCPELMDGGYARLKRGVPPHSPDDKFVTSLKRLSRNIPATIIAGSIHFKPKASPATNTSLVFRGGKLVHRYDKIHLFKPTGDPKFFRRGKLAPTTFTISRDATKIRAGVIVCYDLRFPELPRALAKQGMHILFVPARWPKQRDDAWQALLKARAIENQIFVVGCNARDREGGYSYAFNPMGKKIFSNRSTMRSRLLSFTVDFRQLKTARQLHRNLDEAVFLKKRFR